MEYSDIYTLQKLNSVKDKQDFIKEHANNKWFCRFLYYALNPTLTYNVSKKTLDKLITAEISSEAEKFIPFNDIFSWCDYLAKQSGVDNSTLEHLAFFLKKLVTEDEERQLYIKLLSKTLRLGVTAKSVNKVIPNLIPKWEVQQAYPIDKYPIDYDTEFWLTQKLNGVRATFYKGKFIARSGVPYKGLEHIVESINEFLTKDYVLDGELTLKDKGTMSDNEAFRAATGILNSDDKHKTEICYTIFDVIPIEDFDSSTPSVNYSERRSILNSFEKFQTDSLRTLPVLYHGKDQARIDELLEQMVREDKEGLMLNTNVPYKRTRHRGILKIKRFYTMDLPIVGFEEGEGRLAGTLGSLIVDYKGNEVRVGSGFTDEQRQEYWRNRENLKDLLCEVKYKEISSDKNTGLESLQFPTFVTLRSDKTDISFG